MNHWARLFAVCAMPTQASAQGFNAIPDVEQVMSQLSIFG